MSEKKTIFITGSSSGFGRLTAKKFQAEGWNVVATMRNPEKEVELTKLKNVLVVKLDVTDKTSIKKAVMKGIEKFGEINVLVNNAGYGCKGMMEQISDKNIRSIYDVNVFGLIYVTKEVLLFMRKQKNGIIINISSIAGFVGVALSSIYASTKFAVKGLSESLAMEYKDFNIKVKTVLPSKFETNFNYAQDNSITGIHDIELKNHVKKLTAKKRKISNEDKSNPQEVADMIYMCATENTPIHNVVGKTAEKIYKLKNKLSEQKFLDNIYDSLF
jgi:NAD(P)-dependent dehydrogenase (short-subunit alcohol dehydrogenase family)